MLKCAMTHSPHKTLLLLGAIFGVLAVIIGAFGAHTVSQFVTADTMQTYETGVRYQFYHVFALLALGILGSQCPPRLAAWAGGLFSAGILLFSGSLYAITAIKASGGAVTAAVGLMTPLGGMLFIAGWVVFLIAIANISRN